MPGRKVRSSQGARLAEGRAPLRRRRRLAAAAVFLAGVFLLLLLRERSWSVTIDGGSLTTTAGVPVTLTARVSPEKAVNRGWRWSWTADTGAVEGAGRIAQFQSSMVGEHRVRVTARSSRGTEHTAEVVVTVAEPSYFVGVGPTSRRVDRPEDDPIPDVVHPELPYRITNVTVDKPSVCRGEKATIRVEAEDYEGKADWLLPNIGGRTGWAISMVVPGSKPGKYKIPVQITDPDAAPVGKSAAYQQASAFVELKDCDLSAFLGVGVQQASARVEDVRAHARFHSTDNDTPASYVWDFGDGTGKTTTTDPEMRHKYAGEQERGPGRRVFSYVIKAVALDARGNVLASGVADFSLRNLAEEDERTRHRIDLMADYSPISSTDSDGDHVLDVAIRNLSAGESATLQSLEYRVFSCEANAAPAVETHGAGDVFSDTTVPPRGAVHGRMV
ncbi:MAG TPA: PKD domain-containing protein, partial [Polyangiaceae bacterium]